ncbi:MAG: hypothetical protein RLZZ136_1551, partial [Pseudomonadota bacterium]
LAFGSTIEPIERGGVTGFMSSHGRGH